MASNIDATKPTFGTADTASVRANFAAAKAEIEAAQSAIAAAQASITALQASGVENQAEIDALQAALTPLQNRVDALEVKDADLQEQINGIISSVSAINTAATALAARVTALESDSASQASRLTALESTVNTPSSGIQADLTATKTRVSALEIADVFESYSTETQHVTVYESSFFSERINVRLNNGIISQPSGKFTYNDTAREITLTDSGFYEVTISGNINIIRTGGSSSELEPQINTRVSIYLEMKPTSASDFSAVTNSVFSPVFSPLFTADAGATTNGFSKTFCLYLSEQNSKVRVVLHQAPILLPSFRADVQLIPFDSFNGIPATPSAQISIKRIGS